MALLALIATFVAVVWLASAPNAWSAPARGADRFDVSLENYRRGRAELVPAARESVEITLQTFERRCDRQLAIGELRRRVSEADGDPILMRMMHASQRRDALAPQPLARSVPCPGRA